MKKSDNENRSSKVSIISN